MTSKDTGSPQRLHDMTQVDRPSLAELTERLIAFRDARDWRQFHALKDLIVSLNLEAGELLELTQWKSDDRIRNRRRTRAAITRQRLEEECADVLLYLSADRRTRRHRPAGRRGEEDRDQRRQVPGRAPHAASATKYTEL